MILQDQSAITFFETVNTEPMYRDTAPGVFTKLTADGQIQRVSKQVYPTDRGGAGWPLPAVETSRGTFAFAANYIAEPQRSRQIWEWDGTADSDPVQRTQVFSRSVTACNKSNLLLVSQKDGIWKYHVPTHGDWNGEKIAERSDDWFALVHYLSPSENLVAFNNVAGVWVGDLHDKSVTKISESDIYGFPKLRWIESEP